MTYLKRSNPTIKKHWTVTAMIVLAIIVLFLIDRIFPSFIKTVISPITNTAWSTENALSAWFGSMAELAHSKASLIDENESLRSQLSARESSALLLQSTQQENEELKALLGRKTETKDVLGVVLSRPPASPYDTFIIDIGAADGIKIDDKVYVDGTVLIGDIAEVSGNTSKVALFSSPGRTVQVLLGAAHKEIQAIGQGAGNFTAKIPVGMQAEKGDTLALPQLRDHVFGIIENISADSTDSLKTIFFKAPVNINEIRLVEVEK